MKKKIYFITSSILQIILSIFIIINSKQLIELQISSIKEVYSIFPSDFQERVIRMMDNNGIIFLCATSTINILLNIIIINISFKGTILKKKGLLIGLSIISLILSEHSLISLLAIVNIVILFASKRKNPEDFPEPKKEIPKISYEKSTKKELILGIVLVLIYCSQFLFKYLIKAETSFILSWIVTIAFYTITLISAIIIFKDKFANDFKLFNENLSTYIKYIMPKIGLMYLIYLPCSIICILISKKATSVNQETLESLPLWFTFPLAVFWAPIVEEMIFRGVIRRFIKKDILFIIISATLFGLLHTISEENLQNVILLAVPYSILGGYLAFIYTKTNNIMSNIFSHAFINLVAMTLSTLFTTNFFIV